MRNIMRFIFAGLIATIFMIGTSPVFANHPHAGCHTSTSQTITYNTYGQRIVRTTRIVSCADGYHRYYYDSPYTNYRYHRGSTYYPGSTYNYRNQNWQRNLHYRHRGGFYSHSSFCFRNSSGHGSLLVCGGR